jgi:lipase chaperone LimK
MNARTVLISLCVGGFALVLVTLFTRTIAPPAHAPVSNPPGDSFAFVRSMEGTQPDGAIVQHDDELVVDAELGHLFDYYLAAQGKKDLGAIRAEIERALDQRLNPGAAKQAKRLLASYLAYKRALVDVEGALPAGPTFAQGVRARLTAMQQLRRRHFSDAEIAGLFGATDARDLDTLARLEIGEDSKLDAAQKAARIAALDQRLSPAMRAEREAPVKVVQLEEQVRQLRSKGAGDDEVYRLRAAAFSPEAAGRLAALDLEEARWQQRIQAYLAERARLGPAASEDLRQRYFTEEERQRLGAYE